MTHSLTQLARRGKQASILLLITLTASQCANTSDGQLTQAQGTAIGAAGGALLGNLIGGDTQGTLIGAGVGSLAGFAYGTHVANKKAAYKSTEEWLDACIVQAESKRKEAVAYNRKLNNRLASLQQEVRMAKAANNRSKLASLKKEIVSERSAAWQQSAAFSKEAQAQRSAIKQAGGGGSRLNSLRESTNGIETQVSIMNKGVERYAALESQTDV